MLGRLTILIAIVIAKKPSRSESVNFFFSENHGHEILGVHLGVLCGFLCTVHLTCWFQLECLYSIHLSTGN